MEMRKVSGVNTGSQCGDLHTLVVSTALASSDEDDEEREWNVWWVPAIAATDEYDVAEIEFEDEIETASEDLIETKNFENSTREKRRTYF